MRRGVCRGQFKRLWDVAVCLLRFKDLYALFPSSTDLLLQVVRSGSSKRWNNQVLATRIEDNDT